MTTVRKSLHTLQPAAGDKENLVGPGRMIPAENLKSLREANENDNVATPPDAKIPCNKRKKVVSKPSKSTQVGDSKPVITEEDLTSTAGPSENYWERLAEQRRLALAEALEENEELHDKIERLEAENRIFKELLEEQKSLVEVLKEMLEDPSEESININDSLEG